MREKVVHISYKDQYMLQAVARVVTHIRNEGSKKVIRGNRHGRGKGSLQIGNGLDMMTKVCNYPNMKDPKTTKWTMQWAINNYKTIVICEFK